MPGTDAPARKAPVRRLRERRASEQPTSVHAYVAAYTTLADARADERRLRELHARDQFVGYDAAVVFRDKHDRVHVRKRERGIRRRTWTGAGVGALVGALLPPEILINTAVSGAAQHLSATFHSGMSRTDLKRLGDALTSNQAALVILSGSATTDVLPDVLTGADHQLDAEIADAVQELQAHLEDRDSAAPTTSSDSSTTPSGGNAMTTMTTPEPAVENRTGRRVGEMSELSVIAPLKPGGADRLRQVLAQQQSIENGVRKVGTVHFLRWVIFDDDTRALFATTYEGDWDAYIDDFATKIPELMDAIFSEVEGWPGIASPTVKDFIAEHQITADVWFSAYPDLRLADINPQRNVTAAVDGLLDAVNP